MEKEADKTKMIAKSPSIVNLIFNDQQFGVRRETLAAESLYFASLFTHDFRDSNLSEYTIQYDFAPSAFEDFVKWMTDNTIITKETHVKHCLVKYIHLPIKDLILLLRISSIYAVDNLTNDIIDLIIVHHYVPAKLISVWVAAKELGIIKLEDTCRAAFVEQEWEIPHGQASLLRADKNIISLKPRMPCVVVHKENEDMRKGAFIHCWDGNRVTELTEVKIMKEKNDNLIQRTCFTGMQFIGTDFSIYAIGGEQGFGSGQFNKDIWRYSIITKQWYYLKSLKTERRHMVAAIVSNKLVLVGGVGVFRCKLSCVHVLKLNDPEGVDMTPWEIAADTPETFTEVPLHWVASEKLFVLKSKLHVFCLTANLWTSYEIDNERLDLLYSFAEPCIALHQGSIIYACTDYCQTFLLQLDSSFKKLEKSYDTAGCRNKHDVIISDGRKLYSFTFCDDNIVVEMFEEEFQHKLIYKERLPKKCKFRLTNGYFSIADPSVLRL